jgi:isochorismate synthase EntC
VLSEQHSPDYPQWHALIEQATQAIAAGEMDKVVLARATDVSLRRRRIRWRSWPPAGAVITAVFIS